MSQNQEKKSHTICIVQTTRIGDAIQTLMAARELKRQHPTVKLIFVGRKSFCEPLSHNFKDIFDKFYLFDRREFFYSKTVKKPDLADVRNNLKDFFSQFEEDEIDVCINLSFSKTSGYLTSLIPCRHRLGLWRDKLSNLMVLDQWSQYVYSNVMRGTNCPFNLVDIYRFILGAKSEYLLPHKPKKPEKNIVVHPFASNAKKCWTPNKWVELIYQILKDNPEYKVTIMGSGADTENADQITSSIVLAKYTQRIDNVVGTTSIREIQDTISRASLFLGHDSMGGHLAAFEGVKTITLSLGSVRPHETTPYGDKNINITPKVKCFPCNLTDKCQLLPCHGDISYQLVNYVVNASLAGVDVNEKVLRENVPECHLGSANIYVSSLCASGICLDTVIKSETSVEDTFKVLYNIIWSYIFESKELNLPFPKLNENTYQHLVNYRKGIESLFELNTFGEKFSTYILQDAQLEKPPIERIKENSDKLQEIDTLSFQLGGIYQLICPIIDYFHVKKAFLKGHSILEISQNAILCYREENHISSILHELIDSTLKENKDVKPKSETTEAVNN